MAIYTDTKIAQGPFLFISGQTPSQDGATPEDPQEQTTIVLKRSNSFYQPINCPGHQWSK